MNLLVLETEEPLPRVARRLRSVHNVFQTDSMVVAMAALDNYPYEVVIASRAEFLAQVAERWPNIRRVEWAPPRQPADGGEYADAFVQEHLQELDEELVFGAA